MISIVCSKDNESKIIEHEERMLRVYKEKIQEYAEYFAEYGYVLKVGLMWKNSSENEPLFQRTDFQNGYQCYVYCVVESNGKEVSIKSLDGEVDYYALSTAWNVSVIFRQLLKLRVLLYSNVDDVDAELKFLQSKMCSMEKLSTKQYLE